MAFGLWLWRIVEAKQGGSDLLGGSRGRPKPPPNAALGGGGDGLGSGGCGLGGDRTGPVNDSRSPRQRLQLLLGAPGRCTSKLGATITVIRHSTEARAMTGKKKWNRLAVSHGAPRYESVD